MKVAARYSYGYDLAGNRTYARVEQAPEIGGTAHVNDRSWLYVYDRLNRLSDAMMGQLTADNQGIAYGQGIPAATRTAWKLDNLGNWSAGTDDDSVVTSVDSNGDGQFDPTEQVRRLHHEVNQANEIAAVDENQVNTAYHYDAAGNLAADGTYYYQYDAWNRLVMVNLLRASENGPPASLLADGRLDYSQGANPLGDLVCRYAYDAMGRLMWKQTPTNVGHTGLQRKDYYYDGVRRIQEVINRPVPCLKEPDPEIFDLGTGEGNDELPMELLEGGTPPQQLIVGAPTPTTGCAEHWTDREYVYGPAYVDEFILQIDRCGRAIYMLQDANYNVVALLTGPNDPGGFPAGTILEQYTYDPYGTVLAADNLDENGPTAHAINRVGFQGLFFERYDGDYTQPCIAPNVAGMYYARNRFYSPALGRFLQRDPNETGIPIIAALAMNGQAAKILMAGFKAKSLYADGMNLHEFAGSNPVNKLDPSGMLLGALISAGMYAGEAAVYGGAAAESLGAAFAVVGALEFLAGSAIIAEMDWSGQYDIEWLGYALTARAKGMKNMKTGVGLMIGGLAVRVAGLALTSAAMWMSGSFQNGWSATCTVLGRQGYVDYAQVTGSNYFNCPTQIWNALSKAQQWQLNGSFIDQAIAKRNWFQLATPWADALANKTSATYTEVMYILSRGYVWASYGQTLMPGPNVKPL